ncbi:MAG: hypothetical protein HY961_13660 [Ignavibacteriae bacterium]|nr:hypothetical protein [Ignavibacteriota bacterium]
MMRQIFFVMTMLSLLFCSLFVFGGDDGAGLLARGDESFLRIDYPTAIAAYEESLVQHPLDAELLWRLARVYVCAGEVKENGEGEPYFKKAEEYARRCIRLDSANAEGHTWLAATLGYLALNAGIKDQVSISTELQSEVDKAIALDPANDAAYSIRGSLYRALANVSWVQKQLAALFLGDLPDGGYAEAEAALKKAVALAPDVMRHHYELGVLYVDWGKRKEARRAFEAAAALPVRVAIDRPRLAKTKQFLATLSDAE